MLKKQGDKMKKCQKKTTFIRDTLIQKSKYLAKIDGEKNGD